MLSLLIQCISLPNNILTGLFQSELWYKISKYDGINVRMKMYKYTQCTSLVYRDEYWLCSSLYGNSIIDYIGLFPTAFQKFSILWDSFEKWYWPLMDDEIDKFQMVPWMNVNDISSIQSTHI